MSVLIFIAGNADTWNSNQLQRQNWRGYYSECYRKQELNVPLDHNRICWLLLPCERNDTNVFPPPCVTSGYQGKVTANVNSKIMEEMLSRSRPLWSLFSFHGNLIFGEICVGHVQRWPASICNPIRHNAHYEWQLFAEVAQNLPWRSSCFRYRPRHCKRSKHWKYREEEYVWRGCRILPADWLQTSYRQAQVELARTATGSLTSNVNLPEKRKRYCLSCGWIS